MTNIMILKRYIQDSTNDYFCIQLSIFTPDFWTRVRQ